MCNFIFLADDSIFAIVLPAILLVIGAAISILYIVFQDALYLKIELGVSSWQKWQFIVCFIIYSSALMHASCSVSLALVLIVAIQIESKCYKYIRFIQNACILCGDGPLKVGFVVMNINITKNLFNLAICMHASLQQKIQLSITLSLTPSLPSSLSLSLLPLVTCSTNSLTALFHLL